MLAVIEPSSSLITLIAYSLSSLTHYPIAYPYCSLLLLFYLLILLLEKTKTIGKQSGRRSP